MLNKTVLISAWARKTHDGKLCAKNYPFWLEVTRELKKKGVTTIQVAVEGEPSIEADKRFDNLNMERMAEILRQTDSFISIDSFLPHFVAYCEPKKRGVVIFSKSNPEIFGYKTNINLLKDKKFLRPNQFDLWTNEKLDEDSFVSPDLVVSSVEQILKCP